MSRFLWIPIVIYLLILIGLGQYARPQSDDLAWFYIIQKLGAKGTLLWLWQTNGGRFFSHLLIIGAVKSGWPISMPWLIPALMVLSQFLASYLFLRAVKRHLPESLAADDLFFNATLLTVTPLVLVPQLSTAIYWYTGAALYQSAFILTLLLYAAFISWLNHKKNVWLTLVAILLICTGNTNELSAMFINISFIPVCFIVYKKQALPGLAFLFLSAIALTALGLNISAPGLYLRKEMMSAGRNILTAPASWFFWMLVACWQLIRLPITWALVADLSVASVKPLARETQRVISGVLVISLLLVLYGTGGSLAFRTLNALVTFMALILLAAATGLANQLWKGFGCYRKWIFVLAIIASPLSQQMVQTAISGPFFAQAFDLQWKAVGDPELNFPKVVPLTNTMDSLVNLTHKRQLIRHTAMQFPALLWFEDQGNEQTTLINMLRLSGKDSLCWGNKHIINDHYSFPVHNR